MVEEKEIIIKVPVGYSLIVGVCLSALERVAKGKGRKRHADHDNQPLEEQDIFMYSHGFRRDQIQKKIKEVPRLRKKDQLGELLDIIIYASVEYTKVLEEMKKDISQKISQTLLRH